MREAIPASATFAIGIALALYLFPIDYIVGSSAYWVGIQGDTATNWISYVAFARDGWRWPLFLTTLLNPPNGTNIIFADPIPLLALIGKLIFKTTGYLPNYFGSWVLLSYGLQSTIGYFFLREVRLPMLGAVFASILFLFVPVFLFRFGHVALLSHWAVLLILIVYLRIATQGATRAVVFGLVLCLLLLLVHPYLVVMASSIYVASLATGMCRRRLTVWTGTIACMALLIAIPCLALILGFIDLKKSLPATRGFGFYSMNVLSPLWPQMSAWPGQAGYVLDATGGQHFEGFNYLGMGLLLFGLAGILAHPLKLFRSIAQHIFLAIAVFLMVIYALSSQIYAGNQLVATLSYDRQWPLDIISGVFRSSGRFFWPATYLFIVMSAFAIYARYGERRLIVLSLVAAAIQIADIQPLLQIVTARAAGASPVVDVQAWKAAISRHDELIINSQLVCTREGNRPYIWALGLLAAELGMPSNSALTSRPENDCVAEHSEFSKNLNAGATHPNPLVVVFKDDINATLLLEASNAARMTCLEAHFAYVCSSEHSVASIAGLGGSLSPVPAVKQDEIFNTGEGLPGVKFLATGWSLPESTFVWGVGPISSLSFALADVICGPAAVSLRILPFSTNGHIVDRALIAINNDDPVPIHLPGAEETLVTVPYRQIGCSSLIKLTLQFSHLKSPKELGISTDARLLNWRLISFSIFPYK